eukprot:scaffold4898_cov76-Skeletonema_marinoi.AAC.2
MCLTPSENRVLDLKSLIFIQAFSYLQKAVREQVIHLAKSKSLSLALTSFAHAIVPHQLSACYVVVVLAFA